MEQQHRTYEERSASASPPVSVLPGVPKVTEGE
jgi:hypothetical protein